MSFAERFLIGFALGLAVLLVIMGAKALPRAMNYEISRHSLIADVYFYQPSKEIDHAK